MHLQHFSGFVYRSFFVFRYSLFEFTLPQPRAIWPTAASGQAIAPNAPISDCCFSFSSFLSKTCGFPCGNRRRLVGSVTGSTGNIIRNYCGGAELQTHDVGLKLEEDAKRSCVVKNEQKGTEDAEALAGSIAVGGVRVVQRMPCCTVSVDESFAYNRPYLHKAVDLFQDLVWQLQSKDTETVYKSLRISIEAVKVQTKLEDVRGSVFINSGFMDDFLNIGFAETGFLLDGELEEQAEKEEESNRKNLPNFFKRFRDIWPYYIGSMHDYNSLLRKVEQLEGSEAKEEMMQGPVGFSARELNDEIRCLRKMQSVAVRRLNQSVYDLTTLRKKAVEMTVEKVDDQLQCFINLQMGSRPACNIGAESPNDDREALAKRSDDINNDVSLLQMKLGELRNEIITVTNTVDNTMRKGLKRKTGFFGDGELPGFLGEGEVEETRKHLSQLFDGFGLIWKRYKESMQMLDSILGNMEGNSRDELIRGPIGCTVRQLNEELQGFTKLQEKAMRRLNEDIEFVRKLLESATESTLAFNTGAVD